jgi:2,3-bisphosphoglycerate-independent phosphoglycerate mutase
MKKLFFVILDGAGGTPSKNLKGKTSLEYADTPNLDSLTERGMAGLISVMGKTPPETDNGMLSLFGYDPKKYYTGRGPLEALGSDVKFDEGDLAIRCNFGTIKDGKIIDTGAGRIDGKTSKKLIGAVNRKVKLDDVKFKLHYSLNYRSVLIIKAGRRLSDQISNNHPTYRRKRKYVEIPIKKTGKMKHEKVRPLDATRESAYSANLVNEFIRKSSDVLGNHPINWRRIKDGVNPGNVLLLRGTGNRLPKLEGFNAESRRWLCIGDTPAERGIAKLLGMDVMKVKDPLCDMLPQIETMGEIATNVEKDMETKLKLLRKKLERYDCFYIHIKGPDPFGHQNSPKKKSKVIEVIDHVFFKGLLGMIDLNESVVCVTSDHCTSCEQQAHTKDPVPVLISGNWVERDHTKDFGERSCRKGGMGTIKGTELMNIIMEEFRK